MPLKRGLVRESCDFCFRRKVKCDRSIRTAQGFDSCSRCNDRGEKCCRKDPLDTRMRLHQSVSPHSPVASFVASEQPTPLGDAPHSLQSQPARELASTTSLESLNTVSYTMTPPSPSPNDITFDNVFDLDSSNLYVFDQVFLDQRSSVEYMTDGTLLDLPVTHQMNETPRTVGDSSLDSENNESGWLHGFSSADIVIAGVHAYFDHAALYLPILLPDAFWNDYHAGACNVSLLYAVACRGMPFTSADNKWELQQQIARSFRDSFLESRAASSDGAENGEIRLDELEALALMVDFEYDDSTDNSRLQKELGRLFLTHDALILLTLRSREHDVCHTQTMQSLARARERWVLLCWYVYSVDAFYCLDRKQTSHIPDADALIDDTIGQNNAKGYFDAILALALIARKITQALCGVAARRHGFQPRIIRNLYKKLAIWRESGCPPHLQRPSLDKSNLMVEAEYAAPVRGGHLQLHRAVLWALEINCRMQIEACVSKSRLLVDVGLEAEQAALEIEHQSVLALLEGKQMCEWMRLHESEYKHSFADLAPNLVRNVCAGLCYWVCQRGMSICRRPSDAPSAIGAYTRREGNKGEEVKSYKETIELLKDTTAGAVSHKETARILERLDGQYATLQGLWERP